MRASSGVSTEAIIATLVNDLAHTAQPVCLVLDDFHVTVLAMSFVELSLYVPVAVNCCVLPATMEGDAGVTAIERSVTPAGVTVRLTALLVMLPAVLLTTASNFAPLSVLVVAGVV